VADAGASPGPSVGPEEAPSAGPGVGDLAPDFALRHTFTERVRLADRLMRGPVVLAFYVFDFGHA
jgi:peroxiredoxin